MRGEVDRCDQVCDASTDKVNLADGKYYRNKNRLEWSEDSADIDEDDADIAHQEIKLEKRYSAATKATVDLLDDRLIYYDLIVRLLERVCFEDPMAVQYSAATLVFMPGLAEIRRLHDALCDHPLFGESANFRIFPLHSTISSDNQAAVFDIPPPGVRKIVICGRSSFSLAALGTYVVQPRTLRKLV